MSLFLLYSIFGLALIFTFIIIYQKLTAFKLKGKTVLITGGARGLGLALARRFAKEECNIAICSRNENELALAKDELESLKISVLAIKCDLTKKEEIKAMIDQVIKNFGGLDVLINNAGIIQVGPFENMSEIDFEDALNIHFRAPLNTITEVLPFMKKKMCGRIVNISSIGGKVAIPHLLPYTASKFALSGLSKGLNIELKKYGIKVTTIYPGLIRTGSASNAIIKGNYEKEFAYFSFLSVFRPLTVSAEYAAKRIVCAVKRGKSELVLSFQARLLNAFQFIFPVLSNAIFTLTDHYLPGTTNTDKAKSGHNLRPK